MRMLDALLKYIQVIFALTAVGLFYAAKQKWIPGIENTTFAGYLVLLPIMGIAACIDLIYEYVKKRIEKTGYLIDALEKDLSRNRVWAVVSIRNNHFPELFARLSDIVRPRKWWDWSYVGINPDCNSYCQKLFRELNDVYLAAQDANEIKTSSLTALPRYPLKNLSLIFIGELIFPAGQGNAKDFPAHLWEAESKGSFEISFRKLYFIYSAWDVKNSDCLIKNLRVEHDPAKIRKCWHKTQQELRLMRTKFQSLIWKDSPPTAEERTSFSKSILSTTMKDCNAELFVIIPSWTSFRSLWESRKSNMVKSWILLVFGWLLSPLTFYNDIFINIPIALALAYPFTKFLHFPYRITTGVAYLFTNLFGLFLMYLALNKDKRIIRWNLPLAKTAVSLVGLFALAMWVAGLISHDFYGL